MELLALPAFADNYIWLLHNGSQAVVVDPGEAAPVDRALDELGLSLAGILVTHHHGDHVGGVQALRPRLQGPVWGPAHEPVPGPHQPCQGGERIELLDMQAQVIDVPGHTTGHIAYFIRAPLDQRGPLLFCGDTLFSGGCGRIFEGTPTQMLASLKALAALPGTTRLCCAHEYTLANLRFVQELEPDNPTLAEYRTWCEARRAQGLPTLPSTLALELALNPFLRCAQPSMRAAAMRAPHPPESTDTDEVAVFAALRQWKNEYR